MLVLIVFENLPSKCSAASPRRLQVTEGSRCLAKGQSFSPALAGTTARLPGYTGLLFWPTPHRRWCAAAPTFHTYSSLGSQLYWKTWGNTLTNLLPTLWGPRISYGRNRGSSNSEDAPYSAFEDGDFISIWPERTRWLYGQSFNEDMCEEEVRRDLLRADVLRGGGLCVGE